MIFWPPYVSLTLLNHSLCTRVGYTLKGQAANVLPDTIANDLDKRRKLYSMHICIVNSSGIGKSRIVHEVATKIITVLMCLRLKGTQGFTFCWTRTKGHDGPRVTQTHQK